MKSPFPGMDPWLEAHYSDLDYAVEPDPPLLDSDAACVGPFLRDGGRR